MKIKFNNRDRQILLKSHNPNTWTISSRLQSFSYAFAGIREFFKKEVHAKFHLAATLAVIFLSFYFKVNTTEAIALTISISLVWISEMINTAIEKAMDLVSREINTQIKFIKDVAVDWDETHVLEVRQKSGSEQTKKRLLDVRQGSVNEIH